MLLNLNSILLTLVTVVMRHVEPTESTQKGIIVLRYQKICYIKSEVLSFF